MVDFNIATDPNMVVALPGGQAPAKARTQQEVAQAVKQQRDSAFVQRMKKSGASKADHAAQQQAISAESEAQQAAAYQPVPVGPGGQQQAQGFNFGAAGYGALDEGRALSREVDKAGYTYKVGNNLHAPTQERVQTGREVLARESDLQRDVYDAEIAKAQAHADGLDLVAETQMDIADRAVAREAREVERNDMIRERVGEYERGIASAVEDMRTAQQTDPAAGFENRSAWQKIRTVLASAFRGGAGRDPMAYVNRAMAQEVEAQKLKFGQAQATAQAAMGAMRTGGMGLMESFRAMGADERVASKATEVAILDGVMAKHAENVAQYGTAETAARSDALMNQLQEQRAAKGLELAQLEASQPKYFVKRGSTMGRAEQEYVKGAAKEMRDTGGEAFKQGFATERDAVKMRQEARMKAQEESGGGEAMGLSDRAYKEVREFTKSKDNQARDGVLRTLIGLKTKYVDNDDNMPGMFGRVTGLTSSGHDFNEDVSNAADEALRFYSGANAPEPEVIRAIEQLTSGVNNPMVGGSDNLAKNLDRAITRLNNQRTTALKGLSPEAKAHLQDFTADTGPEAFSRGGTPSGQRSEFE